MSAGNNDGSATCRAENRSGRKHRRFSRLGLAVSSFLLTFLLAEAVTRLIAGSPVFYAGTFMEDPALRPEAGRSRRTRPDSLLGWVLPENALVPQNVPAPPFTTGKHGIRMNTTQVRPLPTGAILACGDSFTLGDEVADAESWPAQLERLLGRPVLNAGVGGYGTDQIVLRAESLVPLVKPSVVVASYFFEDVSRAERDDIYGACKPRFDIRGTNLVLRNVPISRPYQRPPPPPWFRATAGRSLLVTRVAMAVGPLANPEIRRRRVRTDGTEVSCLLLSRLKQRTDAEGVPVVFLLQYGMPDITDNEKEPTSGRRIVEHARSLGIPTVDTWLPLRGRLQQGGEKALQELFGPGGHMTKAGNGFIAGLLAPVLAPFADTVSPRADSRTVGSA